MRSTPWLKAEAYRLQHPMGSAPYGSDFGYFEIPGPCNLTLRVIVSGARADLGYPWEHASVSTKNRCPNWPEMNFIKDIFWGEDEAVMQLHPAKKDYVNFHPYCLHLWKPTEQEIPLPPSIMVGPDSAKGQEGGAP